MQTRQGLITPLEPGPRHVADDADDAGSGVTVRHSVQTTAFRRIEAAVASSCGSLHDANEDAHSALDPGSPLFVVADGVGGGAMAQMASRQLVAHLHAALDEAPLDADRVHRAMLDADRVIAQRIAQVTPSPGAATVALCAPLNLLASKWLLAWVGDCRIYRLGADGAHEVELLSCDDTFRQLGEQPAPGGSPDDPARMVGNGATTGANVARLELACGDLLALCSDGVHKHVDREGWRQVPRQTEPLARRCQALIALARANGSSDDATVLLLRRETFLLPRPRWITRRGATPDTRRNPR